MPLKDLRNSPFRKRWPVKFGQIESFILIFILLAGGQFFLDYNDKISSAREQAERLFAQAGKNVQVELGHIHNAVNILLQSAEAYREAGMLDPADTHSANVVFISYMNQFPFISSINFGDTFGNGYLVLHDGEQWKNRIKKAAEKGIVTWLNLGEKGEVISKEIRRDDYDPRKRPWYQNSVSRADIFWSDPYIFRTTRELGLTAAMRLGSKSRSGEVIGVDITLKSLSQKLATLSTQVRGMTAHLLAQDGSVIACSDAKLFASYLQEGDSSSQGIGIGRFPMVKSALISRVDGKVWAYNFEGKKFLAIMEPVSFTADGKFNLLLTVPEEAFVGNVTKDALVKLCIFLLLLSLVSAGYFFRYLRPLRKIAVAIKEFGGGRPTMLSIDMTRTDEIGSLASEFLRLTDVLAKQEDSLKEQKEFTEKLIENSAAAIFVLDTKHKVVIWNKACEELTGIAASAMVGTSNHWQAYYDHERPCLCDIVLDADIDGLSGLYARYERSTLVPNGLHAEGWYRNMNGSDRYILFDAAPVYGSSGEILAVIETLHDVTRQQRSDDALLNNTERMSAILDSINALIYVADLETHEILFINKFGRDIWGDITGKICWQTLQAEQSGPCAFCTNDRLLTSDGEPTGVYAWEFKNTVNGSWYDCRDQAIRWNDGRLVRMEIATDITERKNAEADLRLQSAALQAAANAIVITDATGTIEWVNPAFTRLSGYTPEEAVGRNPKELVKSGAHDQEFFKNLWDTILKGEVWRGHIMNRHKDGSLYPEEQAITPVKDASGVITHFVAIKRDLSEQQKMEEQIRQSQKMESIGTLAGGIAHDFNNILSAIIGYGQFAQMKIPADDPLRSYIAHILEAADRAAHLTKQLLLFSRKQQVERKPVDLNETVARVENFLQKIIGEDLTFSVELSEEPLPIMADSHQLEQVLMNLATNARDSMPHGGTLTVTTEHVILDNDFVVAHGNLVPGSFALITVSDSGEGMDEETRQRIFEPFFTTKEVGKGTGLGLSVSYGIIKQHDGYISVYSEPGNGTTFRIYLPLVQPEVAEVLLNPLEQTPVGGTETILLAEDDDAVRALTSKLLTEFGYNVIEAVDGADAVTRFKENSAAIDLILTDLIMPKMNGKEVIDEIRKTNPDIKVIFSSGYAPETIQEKVSLDDSLNMISKPVAPRELLRMVRSVLDEK